MKAYRLIRHLEGRAVLGPGLAVIVDARGGDVGVPEPFLHLGDVAYIFGAECACGWHGSLITAFDSPNTALYKVPTSI